MKKILFVSNNDGSDTRINKEVKSISSRGVEVYFLGVGELSEKSFIKKYCKRFILVGGTRRSFITNLKLIWACRSLIKRNSFNSIHIVNEPLIILLMPFLGHSYIVLDLFDSLFLRFNLPRERWSQAKKLVYTKPRKILVTDKTRLDLMPSFAKKKSIILPNFPNKFDQVSVKRGPSSQTTILYNGWMGLGRGTRMLQELLDYEDDIRVIAAGWPSDQETEIFLKHPKVDYRGVVTQGQILDIASSEADYILCLYAPINQNNINASPNKIYDAIQANVPVIINSEVKVSRFVEQNNLGLVLPSFHRYNVGKLAQLLKEKKGAFLIDSTLREAYTWEGIEDSLFCAHNI